MAHGDSIGISWHPKGYKSDPDYYGGDKYDTLLQDLNLLGPKAIDPQVEYKKKQAEQENELLKGIVNMNFMVLWQKKAQSRTCKCGATNLYHYRQIPIKYRKDGTVKELMVQGKKCKDCGRKYIVRKMLLDKYHEVEG